MASGLTGMIIEVAIGVIIGGAVLYFLKGWWESRRDKNDADEHEPLPNRRSKKVGPSRIGFAWIALMTPLLIYTHKSETSWLHLFGFFESDKETMWIEYLIPPFGLLSTLIVAAFYSVFMDLDLPPLCKILLRILIYGGALSMTLWAVL